MCSTDIATAADTLGSVASEQCIDNPFRASAADDMIVPRRLITRISPAYEPRLFKRYACNVLSGYACQICTYMQKLNCVVLLCVSLRVIATGPVTRCWPPTQCIPCVTLEPSTVSVTSVSVPMDHPHQLAVTYQPL